MNRLALAVVAPLILAAILPVAARGQDKPREFVAHDVRIRYRQVAGTADVSEPSPGIQVMLIQGGTGNVRSDTEPAAFGIITNLVTDRNYVVIYSDKSYIEVKFANPTLSPLFGHKLFLGASWKKGETTTVAGIACTDWTAEIGSRAEDICASEDGVPLRSKTTITAPNGNRYFVERTAETVETVPLDPAQFLPPAGYRARKIAPDLITALRDAKGGL